MGEVVCGSWGGYTAGELRSRKAGEDEAALGILGGAETLQDASVVPAKAPIVLASAPGEGVGECIRLIEFAAGRGGCKSPKRGENDSRKTPIESVRGDAADAPVPSCVLKIRVYACCGHNIM